MSGRCKAKTKSGSRCKHYRWYDSGVRMDEDYCYTHHHMSICPGIENYDPTDEKE